MQFCCDIIQKLGLLEEILEQYTYNKWMDILMQTLPLFTTKHQHYINLEKDFSLHSTKLKLYSPPRTYLMLYSGYD